VQEVCAQCHSLEFIAYRNLVGTVLTEEEAKVTTTQQLNMKAQTQTNLNAFDVQEAAAANDFVDGPDKNGEVQHATFPPHFLQRFL
jgi:cytochrome c1